MAIVARRFVAVLAGVLLLAGTAACGGGQGTSAGARKAVVETAGVTLPSQVLGLALKPEDVSKILERTKRPYIDRVGLFSFREDDLVRATLQVSRFRRLADYESVRFRSQLIDLLGSAEPIPIQVEDTTAYATVGNEQQIFAWFQGRGFFVLTTHFEYEFPRALLRRLVSLDKEL